MTQRMSAPGIRYLATWECGGEVIPLTAYDDGYGFMTIGVGHRIQPDEPELLTGPITEAHALGLLADDVKDAEDFVNRYVTVPLQQHQFDALCCWVFNIGITAARKSTLVRELNQGDYDAPVRELPRWCRSAGQVSAGLQNRRADTVELWRDADYRRDH